MNWVGKKVLILGFSKSGISVAKFLKEQNADCYLSEFKPSQDEDSEQIEHLKSLGIHLEFGGHSDGFIDNTDIAVTSPGIPFKSAVFEKLREKNIPIISEIEVAYLSTSIPFIGITGTNGKTTTTFLVNHILNSTFNTKVCGNIGIPPTSLLNENKLDYFVCELSSYQIQMSEEFSPYIACLLNITPDHLDWHGGFENYVKAKFKLFEKHPIAIFNSLDTLISDFASLYKGEAYFFGEKVEGNCCYIDNDSIYYNDEEIISLKDIPLTGFHNHQNVMVAVLVAKILKVDNEKIKSSIKSFKNIEHRLEYVCDIEGVKIYNDSKATNPDASIPAIKSFMGESVTLIAGGRDKNTDLTEFCSYIKKYIKNVILIGEAAKRFNSELLKNGFSNITFAKTLYEAIDIGLEDKNNVLLLSPACASFDMFKSYEERGDKFKEYVLSKSKK